MIDFGIVSVFGPQEQFFRLDHYLSDYIKRCHIKLPYDLDNLLNEVLEEKSHLLTLQKMFLYIYMTKKADIVRKRQA